MAHEMHTPSNVNAMNYQRAAMNPNSRIGRLDRSKINSHTHNAIRDGYCILRDHLSTATLSRWREDFLPLLAAHIEREGHIQNRGSGRFYVTLPFASPFADESIFCDPDISAIVENLVGADFTMVQLASDTPVLGSDYQNIHRDAPPLFPEIRHETPAFQLAVNFPLVDVTAENGPFEVARATHSVSKEDGLKMLESGECELEPIFLKLGDVMIRDVRGLHRGTPNKTDVARPMVVIGYSRKWLLRPEVSIQIPRPVWDGLSATARHMLRFNPIVDSLDDFPPDETYKAYAY